MSPARSKTPRAAKRFHGGHWRIYWTYNYKRYEAVIQDEPCDARRADTILAQANAALSDRVDWPDEIADTPAIRRYLAIINPSSPNPLAGLSAEELAQRYQQYLAGGRSSPAWLKTVVHWIWDLLQSTGGVENLDAAALAQWLDGRTFKPPVEPKKKPKDWKAPAPRPISGETRNKIRTQVGKFCRWVRDRGLKPADWNPVATLARVRVVRRAGDIKVLDDDEVEAVLSAADNLGADGLAIWIALLAGLRRGEIPPLLWTDVGESVIRIEQSKTGHGRHAPLSQRLAERLRQGKKDQEVAQERAAKKTKGKLTARGGKILPWSDAIGGWTTRARRLLEEKLPALLDPKPPAKHASKKSAAAKAHAEQQAGGAASLKIDENLLEWNVFRHTYASRLVRRGVPIDVVAAWMGNSPEVCRRHYARFLPRSGRDSRIDLID